jgi:hypothetical protein|tara:strand:- start:9344 stop:9565 length:222 start_codon:yes stop_codon:yes gene_type:complete
MSKIQGLDTVHVQGVGGGQPVVYVVRSVREAYGDTVHGVYRDPDIAQERADEIPSGYIKTYMVDARQGDHPID